ATPSRVPGTGAALPTPRSDPRRPARPPCGSSRRPDAGLAIHVALDQLLEQLVAAHAPHERPRPPVVRNIGGIPRKEIADDLTDGVVAPLHQGSVNFLQHPPRSGHPLRVHSVEGRPIVVLIRHERFLLTGRPNPAGKRAPWEPANATRKRCCAILTVRAEAPWLPPGRH